MSDAGFQYLLSLLEADTGCYFDGYSEVISCNEMEKSKSIFNDTVSTYFPHDLLVDLITLYLLPPDFFHNKGGSMTVWGL